MARGGSAEAGREGGPTLSANNFQPNPSPSAIPAETQSFSGRSRTDRRPRRIHRFLRQDRELHCHHFRSSDTFRVVEQAAPDSIFKFHDTLTSRAEITIWSDGLSKTMIAVIGLRGSDSRYAALMLDTNKARIFVFDGETERESSAKSPAALRREDGRRRVISAVPTTSIYFTSLITGAQQTAAHIRFIEDASLLADAGGVGALLRFRI
jgi:hypothetical protein